MKLLHKLRRKTILKLVGGPEVMTPPGTNFFDPLDEYAVDELERMAWRKPFEFGWVFYIAGQTERALHAGATTGYLSGRAAAALTKLIECFNQDDYTSKLRGRSEYMDAMLERHLDRMRQAAEKLMANAA